MRSIIVGTAGHIDHGKTSLVRALTGVDADRLPEEKRRGITIDLGFAELDLGEVRVGFVDVPGHERFVKNMLAGAHGVDLVALVVAADEGVMPQTREHFDICRLLGVGAGLVAVTKRDAVEEELLELVRAEVEELVAGSFLEGAPVVAVSSLTGAGLEEFKTTLRELSLKAPPRASDSVARLPVDRAFTMRGFGAVVTGTLVAGEIKEGEEMELLPAGERVRVRGVQVHGAAVRAARAGQRTAVNLGGVETASIERGMVLAPAGRLQPTQIIDARVEVLRSRAAPAALAPARARPRRRGGGAGARRRVGGRGRGRAGRRRASRNCGSKRRWSRCPASASSSAPTRRSRRSRAAKSSTRTRRSTAGASAARRARGSPRSRARRPPRARLTSSRLRARRACGARSLRRARAGATRCWTRALQEAAGGGAVVEAEGVYVSRGVFDELLRQDAGRA